MSQLRIHTCIILPQIQVSSYCSTTNTVGGWVLLARKMSELHVTPPNYQKQCFLIVKINMFLN